MQRWYLLSDLVTWFLTYQYMQEGRRLPPRSSTSRKNTSKPLPVWFAATVAAHSYWWAKAWAGGSQFDRQSHHRRCYRSPGYPLISSGRKATRRDAPLRELAYTLCSCRVHATRWVPLTTSSTLWQTIHTNFHCGWSTTETTAWSAASVRSVPLVARRMTSTVRFV